ncbi:hypothetical protein C4K26_5323 [Pseudomonas chlororaphis]|nr:hypothetical protein C4K26_5323 [Pseudomonas chlororaphis]
MAAAAGPPAHWRSRARFAGHRSLRQRLQVRLLLDGADY